MCKMLCLSSHFRRYICTLTEVIMLMGAFTSTLLSPSYYKQYLYLQLLRPLPTSAGQPRTSVSIQLSTQK